LGWEITDYVSDISSPKGCNTLIFDNTREAVSNTFVAIFRGNVFVGVLDL
jgi:hypothetical protein